MLNTIKIRCLGWVVSGTPCTLNHLCM